MKKIGQLILCIVPLICAFLVQIVVSILGMIVYGILQGTKLAAEGVTDASEIAIALTGSLNSEVLLAISAISAAICMILFGLWYKRSVKKKDVVHMNKIFSFKSILCVIILGMGLQVGIAVLLNIISMLKPDWFEGYDKIMEQLGMGNSIISVLYIVLIAPISEELIFRGVVLEKSKKVIPFTAANILQALLFGLYHMNMVQGIYAFIIGLVLGMVCNKFKSLYASIFLHMIINLSGIILNMISVDDAFFTPIAMGGVMIISIAVIAFSFLNLPKSNVQGDELMLETENEV